MLSQQLTKAGLALVAAENADERDRHRSELASTLQVWKQAHVQLCAGEPATFFGRSANESIQNGFKEIEPHFQVMVDAAERLLANPDADEQRTSLNQILNNESEFLKRMHALVGLYEQEARRHVQQLQNLGLTIMLVILCVQLLIQFGVLRPELSIVGREWEKIEADYELLVESMTDGLVVFDQRAHVVFANKRFSDMLGHNIPQLTGEHASLFICTRERDHFGRLFSVNPEALGPMDLQLCCASGRRIDTMISPRQMHDDQGIRQGLLLVVTDITERKAVEQRSRDLQTRLAHADRLKSMGAMAAALAHEINQPLGAISNYAEGCLARLSGSAADPAELASPLKGILRAAHRGAEIVRRTKDFVRLHPHRQESLSIDHLVHEVVELCRPEARRRGVSLELRLDDELPLILVDGVQIQQVLTNLIQNAFHALENREYGQRRIVVAAREFSKEELEVSVADSGPGIPGNLAETLFDPFVSSAENGTGLGLAIAREIVEAHEGRIWIESNSGGGAVFRFALPLKTQSGLRSEIARTEEDAVVL